MAIVSTTTSTTTTTSNRTGTQIVVNSQANTVSIGNLVTDVSIQPYIANRIVSFYAYNMRPNQRVHIFFDSVLVDQYCAPGIIPSSIADTSNFNSIQKNGNWGDAIYTDNTGKVAGQFNIPAGTFKTGDRVLQITDVTNLTQGNSAITTSSSANFTASNLSVTKQVVTLTTVNPQISSMPVSNTIINTTTTVTSRIIPPPSDPIAQALTINTPNNENGIFATSLDLYFKQKSQIIQNGITVYLCETTNGYPDGSKIIPFSLVHLNYSDVNISSDSSVATNFKFESPIFLNNGIEYAFVVKPDNGDPDYWVYSANLGDIDLLTNQQMFSQPVIGTAFYGATGLQWTALQTEYIKFNLNRAKFTANTGEAYFVNSNTDYLTVSNIGYSNSTNGILPGDYVLQSTNSTPNTSNTSIKGIVNYYDTVKGIIYVSNSSGNFTANSYIQIHRFANNTLLTSPGPNTSTIIAYSNTGSFYNPLTDALVTQMATVVPAGSSLSFKYKGTSNTFNIDSVEIPVNVGTDTEFYDKERIVVSKSKEVSDLSGNKSLYLHASLSSDSEFLSPVIDTVKNQQLSIGNNIDPLKFVYEEFFNSGSSKSKYVSKVITLSDGQDAEDLQVILSAYRPLNSDIQVWVKFLNGEDSDPISNKTWTPLINNSNNLYSDPSNPNDMKEFVYNIPKTYKILTTNGTITSTNSSPTITGNNTNFGVDVKNGWYITTRANSTFTEATRKVIAITNATSLTLDTAFNGNYTNSSYYVAVPPTSAWLSSNTSTALTGTVSVNTSVNIVTGSGTSFNSQISAGSIISINNDSQTVVYVTNNTSLGVGKPWSSTISGANASLITPNGLTYRNSGNSQYSSYKKFQLKIILQSNDSSKVPLIDDTRCLCLQL